MASIIIKSSNISTLRPEITYIKNTEVKLLNVLVIRDITIGTDLVNRIVPILLCTCMKRKKKKRRGEKKEWSPIPRENSSNRNSAARSNGDSAEEIRYRKCKA
jgi:hypothetical protein